MSSCPICSAKPKSKYDLLDGYVICEIDEECPNGCYWYLFAYGSHQMKVAGVYFTWTYHETPEESRDRRDAIELVIERNKCL